MSHPVDDIDILYWQANAHSNLNIMNLKQNYVIIRLEQKTVFNKMLHFVLFTFVASL